MRTQAARLPDRFPVGTRFVIEGRNGRISSRHLEFPDGRQVVLPAEGREVSRSGKRRAPTSRRRS